MLNRLILKVTNFQLPPPTRLDTVVKNILGTIMPPPPMSNRVNCKNSRVGRSDLGAQKDTEGFEKFQSRGK